MLNCISYTDGIKSEVGKDCYTESLACAKAKLHTLRDQVRPRLTTDCVQLYLLPAPFYVLPAPDITVTETATL